MPDDKVVTSAAAPTTSNPLLNQCLNISNYVYYAQYTSFDSTGLGALGLKTLGAPQVNAAQGFYAQAFVTTGATPQIIIGFEGTDLYDQKNPNSNTFTGGQAIADANIYAGQTPAAFTSAAAFTNSVLQLAKSMQISQSNVVVTGHSLGAAEAEYAAATYGLSGYTFGTPGIVAPANPQPTSVVNYVDQGDPVANYANDTPFAYAARTYNTTNYPALILSDSIQHVNGQTLVGPNSNYDNLYDAIEDYRQGDDYFAVRLDTAIGYHYLSNYQTDLQQLYNDINIIPINGESDGSTRSGGDLVGLISATIACFTTGTRIATARGAVRVEHLAVGDLVVTSSGAMRPIRWLGHRTLACGHHPRPEEVMPVRIRAHAFGPNRPERDLCVSPGHAICVDAFGETLVPAGALVDGARIAQEVVERVTYWHVELDSHDILLAENLPSESYLEMGNRGFFAEANAVALKARPDAPATARAAFCRPYVADGPLLAAVRVRLAHGAAAVGAQSLETA